MKNFKKMNLLSLMELPTPMSISFLWNVGFLLGMVLFLQLISGLFLSMNYLCSLEEAYYSVIHIMRDIQSGWLMRYMHLNGASLFFILIFFHLWRGIFFNSSKKLFLVWLSGVVILLLAMMTAFMGYVLPWGQMSYWGATVITSMISSLPYMGLDLNMWLWGDYSVSQPMLNRMFSMHFIVPLFLLVFVFVHLFILHFFGSTNPLGVNNNYDKLKFFPYFLNKDFFSFFLLLLCMSILICVFPLVLGDPENFNPAGIFNTPTHIKPEWYFLFAYAILRSVPSKLGGVLLMLLSILVLLVLILKKSAFVMKFMIWKKMVLFLFISVSVVLTWLGGKPVSMIVTSISQIMTFLYFLNLILLCLFSLLFLKNLTFSKLEC